MKSAKRILLCLLLVGVLAACVAPTRIESNTAAQIDKAPEKIFVLSSIGNEFGDGFYAPFVRRLTEQLKACGVQSAISTVSELDLDPSVHMNNMKAFAPDHITTLRRNGGTRMNTGSLIQAIYDVRLRPYDSPTAIWRANVSFARGGTLIPIATRGEVLADDISDRLISDGILKNCHAVKKRDAVKPTSSVQ